MKRKSMATCCKSAREETIALFFFGLTSTLNEKWLRTNLSVRIQFHSKFDFRSFALPLARIHSERLRPDCGLLACCIIAIPHAFVRFHLQIYGDFVLWFYWIYLFGWTFLELKQQSYRNLKRHRVQMPHDIWSDIDLDTQAHTPKLAFWRGVPFRLHNSGNETDIWRL